MKKTLRLFIFLSLAILLTACDFLKVIPPITRPKVELDTYEATTEYEERVMEVTEALPKYNFIVTNGTSKYASATIIDKTRKDNFSHVYTFVTTSELVSKPSDVQNLKIDYPLKVKTFNVDSYVIGTLDNVMFLRIVTTEDLELPTFEKESYYEAIKGQTVLSVGTPYSQPRYSNYMNEGIISDYSKTDGIQVRLTSDIASNYGNGGSGVYDLNNQLIGIITARGAITSSFGTEYASEGTTIITTMNAIFQSYAKLDDNDFVKTNTFEEKESITISNILGHIKTYESQSLYEQKVIETTKDIQNHAVVINYTTGIRTGVIYKKETLPSNNHMYYVVSSNFEIDNSIVKNAKIEANGKQYTIQDYVIYKLYNIIVYRFKTEDILNITELKTSSTEGIEIVQGQTVLSLGTPFNTQKDANYVSKGILSKHNVLSNQSLWSHDVAVNPSMYGAPLFNLNGEWIGINFSKVNNLKTSVNDSNFYAEGLTYAVSANVLGPVLNSLTDFDFLNLDIFLPNIKNDVVDFNHETYIPYESPVDHEKAIIDVLSDVYGATVAVSASSSHGSGVIYKKEAREDGGFYYYVATNYHVIDNAVSILGVASSITIFLGNEMGTIEAIGYTGEKTYDIASLKITTRHELDVLDIKENREIKQGQTIISLGSPYDYTLMFNHASVGVVSLDSYDYDDITNLTYMQDSSINPGNSGGPSYNLKGELIGLNVAKLTSSRGYHNEEIPALGLGYTLNMHVIGPKLNNYLLYNSVEIKPRLGITVQNIETFKVLNTGKDIPEDATEGVVVIDVDINRGAFGYLHEYDLITHIDGTKIVNIDSLGLLPPFKWDQVAKVTVVRNVNGEFITMEVMVQVTWSD